MENVLWQAIDSDIRPFEEITKLTTGQGGNYTIGFTIELYYMENHYRLLAVDQNRQK